MSYLLRVALPDVPGSLGRLATAIGWAGGNIDAIEIIEHGADGSAVDDVFLTLENGVMPDSVVSACNQLDGVDVQWISRYTAGGNLFLDLEVVEAMTQEPERATDLLLEALPAAFRVDWAVQLHGAEIVGRTVAAPEQGPGSLIWPDDGEPRPVATEWPDMILAAVGLGEDTVVIARHGGPEILDSEIARLRHLCALGASIRRD